jgi:hypothetical protein
VGLRLAMNVYESLLLRSLKPTAAYAAHLADDDSGDLVISVAMVQHALSKCRTMASAELQQLRDLGVLVSLESVRGGARRQQIRHRFNAASLPNSPSERPVGGANSPSERSVGETNSPSERSVGEANRPSERSVSTWNQRSVRTSVLEENTNTKERTSTRTGADGEVNTPHLEHLGHVSKLVHEALDAQPDLSDADLAAVVKTRCLKLGLDHSATERAIVRTRQVRANLAQPRPRRSAPSHDARRTVPGAAETDLLIEEMTGHRLGVGFA